MLSVNVQNPRVTGQATFEPGMAALVGLSGAGKTSLFRLMAGLDSGSDVAIHGRSLGTRPAWERPIRYVPQRPSLIPHQTIGSQVSWVQRIGHAALNEWIFLLALEPLWHRFPRELSGGEQQRAALIRALATDPEILLLDEALSAVDRPHRLAIWDALKERWPRDRLLIFSTHDWADAETWADTITYLEAGRLYGPQDARNITPLTAGMARLMGFLGAIQVASHQWLWLHPASLRVGARPEAPWILPGRVVAKPLTPLRFRYTLATQGRTFTWTGPPIEGPIDDQISVFDPVITPFGEEARV